MTSVRAGHLAHIYSNNIPLILFKEIIYYSGIENRIRDFNTVHKILPLLDQDNDLYDIEKTDHKFYENQSYIENYLLANTRINGLKETPTLEINLSHLFSISENIFCPYYKSEIYFPKKIIDIEPIGSEYFSEYIGDFSGDFNEMKKKDIKLAKIKSAITLTNNQPDLIDLSWVPYNKNLPGIRSEEKIIRILNEKGWKVERVQGAGRGLNNSRINGRPDGLITEGEYSGCYLEIKCKSNLCTSDYYQIYGYYFIFQSPIVLVQYAYKKLTITYYSKEKLSCLWKEIENIITRNCDRIGQLLDIKTYDSYRHLAQKMQHEVRF